MTADAEGIKIMEPGLGLFAGPPDEKAAVLVADDDIGDDLFELVICLGQIPFQKAAVGQHGLLHRRDLRGENRAAEWINDGARDNPNRFL
jgi:hypothetical protein